MIRPAPRIVLVLFLTLVFSFVTMPLRSQQTNLPPPSERYPFARGTIKQLDFSNKRISITTPSGLRSFGVTARTYIFRGKEKITLDKLKVGEGLKLSFYTNEFGQTLVERIKTDQTGSTTDVASPLAAPR